MKADRQRYELIAVLVVAAIVAAVSGGTHSRLAGFLGLPLFLLVLAFFLRWRRTALAERRARVFDREAQTDETRPGPDR